MTPRASSAPAASAADEAGDAVTLLRATAARHGDVDAFVEASGDRITFSQWDAAADGVAAALADRGVVAGDVVCLLLPSSIPLHDLLPGRHAPRRRHQRGQPSAGPVGDHLHPRALDAEGDGGGRPSERRLPPTAGMVIGWAELEGWVDAAAPAAGRARTGHRRGHLLDGRDHREAQGSPLRPGQPGRGGRGVGRALRTARPPAVAPSLRPRGHHDPGVRRDRPGHHHGDHSAALDVG